MANSYHDGNGVPTLTAMQTDGVLIGNLKADSSTHALLTSNGTTGMDNGPTQSRHDGNNKSVIMATSSVDGKTPVPLYMNAGILLIDSI